MASVEERLATVEAIVEVVRDDVAEVKRDVKSLLLSRASSGGQTGALLGLTQRIVPWLALVLAGATMFRG